MVILLILLILFTIYTEPTHLLRGCVGDICGHDRTASGPAPLSCCLKTAVLLNNNYVIIPCGPQYLFGPRLGDAREYGSVMVDQEIVSDHEKCAIFVIATELRIL
jgi:hypothetical protein